jgi:glycosyltransferase involved in cell wall biosynthesis
MDSPAVSVVIPVLNGGLNLPHVLARIPPDTHEVVLVDGNFADDTVQVAQRAYPRITVVSQTRKGNGNALACGFAAATGDIIAMIDADGSADPQEIPRFVAALLAGADFAKGSRFVTGGGSSDITAVRRIGNHLLTGLFNACYRRSYTDLCYGYNAFWRHWLPVLGLDATTPPPADGTPSWGDGFEVETLIHVRAARAGLRVAEVPSYEHARMHGLSRLNTARDGLRLVRTMIAERGAGRGQAAGPPPRSRARQSQPRQAARQGQATEESVR